MTSFFFLNSENHDFIRKINDFTIIINLTILKYLTLKMPNVQLHIYQILFSFFTLNSFYALKTICLFCVFISGKTFLEVLIDVFLINMCKKFHIIFLPLFTAENFSGVRYRNGLIIVAYICMLLLYIFQYLH